MQANTTQQNQNFGLLEAEFQTMVHDLRQGNEHLFEHIFKKHFADCRRFLIVEKGVPSDDAYDLTIDTILEFRDLLIAGKVNYGNLRFLFTRIAYTSWLKKNGRRMPTTDIDDIPLSIADTDEMDWDDDSFAALGKAWDLLEKKCQDTLRLRYYDGLQIQQIADLREAKANTITQEGKRCLAALKALFFKYFSF